MKREEVKAMLKDYRVLHTQITLYEKSAHGFSEEAKRRFYRFKQLSECIGLLSKKQQAIINKVFIEECSIKEYTQALDLSLSAAYKQISRIIDDLVRIFPYKTE